MINIEYESVKMFILPAILEHFSINSEDIYEDLVIDAVKFSKAAEQVTEEAIIYCKCFDGTKYLDKWSDLFNYAFIHFANQQTAINYEQINSKYHVAVEFFKSIKCPSGTTDFRAACPFICSSIVKKKRINFF